MVGGSIPAIAGGIAAANARRKRGLELLNTQLKAAPKVLFVGTIDIIVELNLHNRQPVARVGFRLLLLHLFISEDVILQRLGHLLLHFVDHCTGINSHYHTLSHGEVGKFVLVYLAQCKHTEGHQHSSDENYDLAIVHRPFYYVSFFIHVLLPLFSCFCVAHHAFGRPKMLFHRAIWLRARPKCCCNV